MILKQFSPETLAVNICGLIPPRGWSGLPEGLRFLDPGICSTSADFPIYAPESLPLGPTQVKGLLAQFSQLARECRDPGELLGLRQGLAEDFYSGTSLAVMSELRDRASGTHEDQPLTQALVQAQTILCLAWVIEESVGDIVRLEEDLAGQWQRFTSNLGLDEADQEAGDRLTALSGPLSPPSPEMAGLPKPLLIESLLAFIPPRSALFTADEELRSSWEDFGLAFRPAQAQDLAALPLGGLTQAGTWLAKAPGYVLAMSRREPAGKPWLKAERLVVFAKL
jgi:hypothetical protein